MKYAWLVLLLASCHTYTDITAGAKGSVENPVLCDQPQGQRRYLNLLRGKEGEEAAYEYLDSVAGPRGRILDRFRVENPARRKDTRSPFSQLLDYVSEPVVPIAFRVYMDLYHPGKEDNEPVPGFILGEAKKDSQPADSVKSELKETR